MASPAPPAVCSTAAYQHFLPLAGFPPAQGLLIVTSLVGCAAALGSASGTSLQQPSQFLELPHRHPYPSPP
ncbi:hypothetical protein HO173_003076 [Letharia columbiana]|uniref:Uncharacterized protein n=1 Tax=Letharia columbiana TaxID=112416 RepID=A0A8H6L7N2_9LECA|nr:uncharacterized protein HO173_003076 [Letharia columbiana]KAF6238571.1 hypothetical protein HO173_003076 [Letharia columbiana]